MATPEQLISGNLQLCSLPEVYWRLREVLENPCFRMSDVAQAVGQDPGVAARLLRIANSAAFGFASDVDSVTQAVTLLGTQQVHDLVLATTVVSRFDGIRSDVIDLRTCWQRSVHMGIIARLLAQHCEFADPERLFVAGLLGEIGHLVMYQRVPHRAEIALQRYVREHRPLYLVERDLVGCDYAEIGGALLESWNLPGILRESVGFHTVPALAPRYPLEASIVHVASVLSDLAVSAPTGKPLALQLDAGAAEATGLDNATIERLAEQADLLLESTLELFAPRLRHAA